MTDETPTIQGTPQSGGAIQGPRLIVIRHGERQDEVEDAWSETAAEPWDPPLSKKGRQQALEAGRSLLEDHCATVTRVITSPFLRCLETTAMLLDALDLPWASCTVDCRLSEVLRSSVLIRGLAASVQPGCLEAEQDGKAGEEWLWGGQTLADRLAELLPPGAVHDVRLAESTLPAAEETPQNAHRRYCRALEDLLPLPDQPLGDLPGKTVLVVTHGECVRAAVDLAVQNALVYEVLHCGFIAVHGRLRDGGPHSENAEISALVENDDISETACHEESGVRGPDTDDDGKSQVLERPESTTSKEEDILQADFATCTNPVDGEPVCLKSKAASTADGFCVSKDSEQREEGGGVEEHRTSGPPISHQLPTIQWEVGICSGVSWLIED